MSAIVQKAFDAIWNIIPIAADICLFFIAVYTFRLTAYPQKLKILSVSYGSSMFNGNNLEITIENQAISPITVTQIQLVNGDQLIQVFKGNTVIDGFKSEKFKFQYTAIMSHRGEPIKLLPTTGNQYVFYVETSRGLKKAKFRNRINLLQKLLTRKINIGSLNTATSYSKNYNGKLVSMGVRYVLSFADSNNQFQTIFIDKSGIMSSNILGYNGLPKEIMHSELTLRDHFDAEFKRRNLNYTLTRIEDPFADTNVDGF